VKVRAEKSGLPAIAAITGVSRFSTSEVTSAAKATPITIPTATSTTLPRSRNERNSFARPAMIVDQVRQRVPFPL
jgi:hypothetical protein